MDKSIDYKEGKYDIREYSDIKYYYFNGKLHNENGPAIYYKVSKNGYWFLNGKQYNVKSVDELIIASIIK